MGSANNSLCCTSDLTLKMNSNQKTFNIKVVHLVEMVKFAFGSSSEVVCGLWDLKIELLSQTYLNPSSVNFEKI